MPENKTMKKMAIITNFNVTEKVSAASKVASKLISLGVEVCAPLRGAEKFALSYPDISSKIDFVGYDKMYENLDAVIVLGGDGSILDATRHAALRNVPTMGINLGHLGYLAEFEADELDALDEVVKGNYYIDERAMLHATINSQKRGKINFGYALNDAIISNGSIPKLIDLTLFEGGTQITSYRADGIIVATPTGSTAYSMSAGGAIADPRLKCFCVTPICPHSLASKPLIFPDDAILEIKNECRRERVVYLTLDGRMNYELYYGDSVELVRAPVTAKFIRTKPLSFYQTLRSKMNVNEIKSAD